MKQWLIAGFSAAVLLFAGNAAARVDIGVNIGVPGPFYSYGPPMYVNPPAYYAPPPVFYSPRPVYYGPRHHSPRHWDRHDRGQRDWHGRGHHRGHGDRGRGRGRDRD